MTNIRDVPDTLRELKDSFREVFAPQAGGAGPRSVFLIGSTAGEETNNRGWYQDIDVHLLFGEGFITSEQLDLVGSGLEAIKSRFSKEGAFVDWNVRDRHWKLVPDQGAGLNLSIHATIANVFDYQRRILHNPILGWNMYNLCEVLAGDHPGSILHPVPPAPLDHFHGVGGIGWMIENFYRALWLHFTEPERQDFFPYLAGYCWNVASSVSLQLFTLLHGGGVATRRQALQFALGAEQLPVEVRDDLRRTWEWRYRTDLSAEEMREVVNATGRVVRVMADAAAVLSEVPINFACGGDLKKFAKSDIAPLSEVLGRPARMHEVHCWVDHGYHLYESFAELVEDLRPRHPNSTSLEYFEALSLLVEEELGEVTRLYFWSDLNLARLMWSHDFGHSRSQPSLVGALWGWEHGCQALLQRINETYVTRGSSRTRDQLARAARAVARERLSDAGFAAAKGSGDDLLACAQDLSSWLKHSKLSC